MPGDAKRAAPPAAALTELDAMAARTPDIDVMCSSSAWALSAREAFDPAGEVRFHQERGVGLALARSLQHGVSTMEPWELAWGFACPILGSDVALACQLAAHVLGTAGDWEVCCLAGLPRTAPWASALGALTRAFAHEPSGATVRSVAALDGGLDGYLARRSAGFRKQWRRRAALAADQGLAWEHLTPAPAQCAAILQRIMAVEARSWKGRAGSGLVATPMRIMYARLLERLAARGQARVGFVARDGIDLAYILGGVCAGTYRGFQFAYDDDHGALSLGNLSQQLVLADLLTGEPQASRYDLGSEMAYKSQWAEQRHETSALLLFAT